MQAIDTPYSVLGSFSDILGGGYNGIIRYISPNTQNFPNKQLTAAEVTNIHAHAGLRIGLVFERLPTSVSYFTPANASADATNTLGVLGSLGVPPAVPVFFTVDYDASQADLTPIAAYFASVHQLFQAQGRSIGVYGSGRVCSALKAGGQAPYTWLAQSRGWANYQDWKPKSDIIQGPESTVGTLSVDTDYVVNESVLW